MSGEESRPNEFDGGWFVVFPDAHAELHGLHIIDDVAVDEGTFGATDNGVLGAPRRRTDWPLRRGGVHRAAPVPRWAARPFNVMFDRLLMLEQLGLVPAPAPAG
jgi:hypothetical protein